jgi:hypothetical protein
MPLLWAGFSSLFLSLPCDVPTDSSRGDSNGITFSISIIYTLVNFTFAETGLFFQALNDLSMKFGSATQNFSGIFFSTSFTFYDSICLIRTISCPSEISPNMPVSRMQKTIASPLLIQIFA